MKSTSKNSATKGNTSLTEDQIEAIAMVCHDANRTYCQTLGDNSQVVWSKASVWQRKSAIDGVKFVLANPNASSEMVHESWMAVKIKDGWTLGPIKDGAKKTHPCLVPYEQLPLDQRKKDQLFRAIVKSLV